MAYCLFGDKRRHAEVRHHTHMTHAIVRPWWPERLLMVDVRPRQMHIDAYIPYMIKAGIWGEDQDLWVLATHYHVPIVIGIQNRAGKIHWEIRFPLDGSHDSFDVIIDMQYESVPALYLLNEQNQHYSVIKGIRTMQALPPTAVSIPYGLRYSL